MANSSGKLIGATRVNLYISAPKIKRAGRSYQSRNAPVDNLSPITQSAIESGAEQTKAQSSRAAPGNWRVEAGAGNPEAKGRASLQDFFWLGERSSNDRYLYLHLAFTQIPFLGIPQRALEKSVEGLECEILRLREKNAKLEALLTNHEPLPIDEYKMRIAEFDCRLSDLRTSYFRFAFYLERYY